MDSTCASARSQECTLREISDYETWGQCTVRSRHGVGRKDRLQHETAVDEIPLYAREAQRYLGAHDLPIMRTNAEKFRMLDAQNAEPPEVRRRRGRSCDPSARP